MPNDGSQGGFWSEFWVKVATGVLILLLGGSPWWIVELRDGSFSTSSIPNWLKDKAEIELQIDGKLWLDGLTEEAKVELSPSAEGIYTGTGWIVHIVDDKNLTINLETKGELAFDEQNVPIKGSTRWLNAGDREGTVGLVESPEGDNSKWKVYVVNPEDDRNISLETLDGINNRRCLEGNTDNQTVRLAESKSNSTLWRVRSR